MRTACAAGMFGLATCGAVLVAFYGAPLWVLLVSVGLWLAGVGLDPDTDDGAEDR